jgi:alpha,alpha-trehalose phosphorylase (configuration-retaining)
MHDLLIDAELYDRISKFARKAVSDEVSTVGNAVSWLYLAEAMSRGEILEPNGRWINDMAREAAGQPYGEDEQRLPREKSLAL